MYGVKSWRRSSGIKRKRLCSVAYRRNKAASAAGVISWQHLVSASAIVAASAKIGVAASSAIMASAAAKWHQRSVAPRQYRMAKRRNISSGVMTYQQYGGIAA